MTLRTVAAGTQFVRVHHARFAAHEFDTPRALPFGRVVIPTPYGAFDDATATAEALVF